MAALKKASAEISNKRCRLFYDSVLASKTYVTEVPEIIIKEQSSFEISTVSPYVGAFSNPRSLCVTKEISGLMGEIHVQDLTRLYHPFANIQLLSNLRVETIRIGSICLV